MSNSYVQPGETLTVTNGTGVAITAGNGILVGAKVGVAMVDLAIGGSGSAMFSGVHKVNKNTGASTGGAQGANAYWDNTAKKFTAVSTSNTLVGYFAAACVDGDTTCFVKLLG